MHTQPHIHQYICTHKGVYVITHTKDKTRFVKMSSVVFVVENNKWLAMVCPSVEELTDGRCLLLTVSAHGDASSHSELVSWSPNWSQSSKDHPTQYQLDSKQKCDQTSSMPDRRQNPIPEHSPQGSQGVIPAYLSALHLLFTQPCNTPVS